MKTLPFFPALLAIPFLLSACSSAPKSAAEGRTSVSVETASSAAKARKRSKPSYVYNPETRQYEWMEGDIPATSPYQQ